LKFSGALAASRSLTLRGVGLQLLGLWTMAVTLPVFTPLGQGATFFVAHNTSAAQLLLFTLLFYAGPPVLVATILCAVQRLDGKLALRIRTLVVALLIVLWSLGGLSGLSVVWAVSLAALVGMILAWLYTGYTWPASFLQVLGLVSPLVPLQFLFLTPVSTLLSSHTDQPALAGHHLETPVMMLVLDELSLAAIITPAGDVDRSRLPGFGRLAAMSTWYSNTTTGSTRTERAVPTILSGLRVREGVLPIQADFPQNLFTLLAPSHSLNVVESGTRLCPASVCYSSAAADLANGDNLYSDALVVYLHTLLPAEWAHQWLPSLSGRWSGFRIQEPAPRPRSEEEAAAFGALAIDMNRDQTRRFSRFRKQVGRQSVPAFDYLHLALPHVPWMYLPDGTLYNGHYIAGEDTSRYGWGDNDFLIAQGLLRYALQVEFSDRLLGLLLDELEGSGRLDDTLLVVVADHGLAFQPGLPRRDTGTDTLAAVARVPLFIKYPDQQEGRRLDWPAETIDILPTIAQALEITLPQTVDGRSLLKGPPAGLHQRQVYEAGSLVDLEAHLDILPAARAWGRVVRPGTSALHSLGQGSAGSYVGGPEEDLIVTGQSPHLLVLERPEWYRPAKPSAAFLPVRLTGRAEGLPPGTPLFIAVNGEVAGSGESWGADGEVSIMLRPALISQGVDSLSAYLPTPKGLLQLPVERGMTDFEIKTAVDGSVRTVTGGDQRWEAGREDLLGAMLRAGPAAPVQLVQGWTWDQQAHKHASQLLLINGDAILSSGFDTFKHPLQAAQVGADAAEKLWFTIILSPDLQARPNLSVVALFDDGSLLHLRAPK
jgi:hypothetical protein